MEKYDAVVIGAGIGGLVCGCYLAKAGLRVLIIEQHSKPGGYCTSFERKGFKFDVGPHYLGSLREGGILHKVLKDLDLLDRISFLRNDPTDRFIISDKTLFIREDKNKTKDELIAHFPKEKENIEEYFKLVLNLNNNFLQVVARTKKITFSKLLDNFFTDYKLKAFLSIPLISIGLPSTQSSALVALVLYKEFIFDGGYYPRGGMQILSDLLLTRFKEFGGNSLLSTKVKKIITKNNKIEGIETNKREIIHSKFVVSNADAEETFKDLLDCKNKELQITKHLKTSISAFVVYLGLSKELSFMQKHYITGYYSNYNIDKCYKNKNILKKSDLDYFFCIFPSFIDPTLVPKKKNSVKIFIGADFVNEEIWKTTKDDLYFKIIKKIDNIIPDIEESIEVKEIATPYTFKKYTSNKNGAMFGWEAIPEQVDKNIFPSETSIMNLYLTGHWVTKGIGQSSVSLVAFCGSSTAKLILRKNKI